MSEQQVIDAQDGWPEDATHVWLADSYGPLVIYKMVDSALFVFDGGWKPAVLAVARYELYAKPIRRQPKSLDAEGWYDYPAFKPECAAGTELEVVLDGDHRIRDIWFPDSPEFRESFDRLVLRWRYTDTAEQPTPVAYKAAFTDRDGRMLDRDTAGMKGYVAPVPPTPAQFDYTARPDGSRLLTVWTDRFGRLA